MPLPRQQQHASSVSDDGPLNVLGPQPQRSESACHLFPHGSNRFSNETTVFLRKRSMNTWKESQQTVPGPIYCCQEYPSYTCLRQVENRARTSDSREVYCRSWESNRPVFICHLSKLRKLFPDLYNRVGSESQFREYVVAE